MPIFDSSVAILKSEGPSVFMSVRNGIKKFEFLCCFSRYTAIIFVEESPRNDIHFI